MDHIASNEINIALLPSPGQGARPLSSSSSSLVSSSSSDIMSDSDLDEDSGIEGGYGSGRQL